MSDNNAHVMPRAGLLRPCEDTAEVPGSPQRLGLSFGREYLIGEADEHTWDSLSLHK